MENRAIITGKHHGEAIYLHWNGGKDSVEGFLAYAKLKGYNNIYDLYTVIKPMLQGSCEICCSTQGESVGDNGTYLVDFSKMKIVGRECAPFAEQAEYKLVEFMAHVDSYQPEHMQFKAYLTATDITSDNVKELQVGDAICCIDDIYNTYKEYAVVGFGADMKCNGRNVKGLPIINKCVDDNGETKIDNPNNYIDVNEKYSPKYRKIEKVAK